MSRSDFWSIAATLIVAGVGYFVSAKVTAYTCIGLGAATILVLLLTPKKNEPAGSYSSTQIANPQMNQHLNLHLPGSEKQEKPIPPPAKPKPQHNPETAFMPDGTDRRDHWTSRRDERIPFQRRSIQSQRRRRMHQEQVQRGRSWNGFAPSGFSTPGITCAAIFSFSSKVPAAFAPRSAVTSSDETLNAAAASATMSINSLVLSSTTRL